MNVKSKQIVQLVALIALGFVIGTYFSEKNTKPVVIFEDHQKPSAGEIVLASYSPDEMASVVSLNQAFVKIAENVSPAVVTITTTKVINTPSYFTEDEFFRRFFGIPEGGLKQKSTALGSGVIVNEKGYILTNNHVVENGEEIKVKLDDKREYDAEIVGTDPRTDIAVIKIDGKKLPYAVLGSSEKLKVGEWVAAIGSPLREDLAHTITAGIVSAKGRNLDLGNTIGSFIQTDAAINPGNSGGALVNIKGELIGINTAIATDGGRGNIGIGFAIPIDLAKKIMSDLIEDGKVNRAWVGVGLQEIDDETAKANDLQDIGGALVNNVMKGSPAEKAGLDFGDIIIKVDNEMVKDVGHLQYLIASKEVGQKVDLTIIRNGKEKIFKMELAEWPDDLAATGTGEPEENEIEHYGIKVTEITPLAAEKYEINPDESGILVTAAERDSEFKAGDIIKRIDNKKIGTVKEFKEVLKGIDKEYFMVLVKRGQNTFFITLEKNK
ncbi:MAG: Do family serine endopeptidase [Candidatus Marinimicrobia bacterium]|nr:Do family serine endopeptidase [Candidatus Neomarinimicrobiota bacterium]